MKRVFCLSLLLCLLLCACGKTAEAGEAAQNRAYAPYAGDETALGVILNEPFADEPEATVTWREGDYDRAYIIPREVGSYVNLYGLVWDDAGGYGLTDKAVQSACAEDGCVIFSVLERPEGMPMWYVEIVSPCGETGGMLLQYNGETGTPAREYIFPQPDLSDTQEATYAKPVIYLYPQEETEVTVRLDFAGTLTCTYPAYEDGWTVTAQPDGTLTDAGGKTYSSLFWEGEGKAAFDFSEGFCVAGRDTAAFLEDALQRLGLNRREANEFIVYWLPLMEKNPYNVISFQTAAYTDAAQLSIAPAPDTLLRVFMAWYPADEAVQLAPQELTAPERTGFVAVEWGGAQVR